MSPKSPIAPRGFSRPNLVLRRMSWLARTVRYEWDGESGKERGPVFTATLQEWERARD